MLRGEASEPGVVGLHDGETRPWLFVIDVDHGLSARGKESCDRVVHYAGDEAVESG